MSENVYNAPAAAVELSTKPCGECGEPINKKAVICPKCGCKQKGVVNKTVLLLITFFLGGLGGHKFYLKKPVWGVIYLLFFWTYIPTLAALIEFVIYAFTSEEKLNEKYESGGGSTAIVLIVAVFIGIAMIGILAAIAIPAYSDYTTRAKAMQALQSANEVKMEVEQYIVKNGRLPAAAEFAAQKRSVPNIATIQVVDQGIVLVEFLPQQGQLGDKTIEVTPVIDNGRLTWNCFGGTLPAKYRPASCRQQ